MKQQFQVGDKAVYPVHGVAEAPGCAVIVEGLTFEDAALHFVADEHPKVDADDEVGTRPGSQMSSHVPPETPARPTTLRSLGPTARGATARCGTIAATS